MTLVDMLLDATLFRDYLAGDAGARGVVDGILDGSSSAAVSAATVFELWQDPGLDRRTEMALAALMGFVEVAPLTEEAARRAGVLLASGDAANRDGPASEGAERREGLAHAALVAAVALERGAPVYTRDGDGYAAFGVEVVSY